MSIRAAAPAHARSVRLPRLLHSPRGVIGTTMFVMVVAAALIGPLVAPYPLDKPIGEPGAAPNHHALLGTDALGRDVLSRVLHGGFSILTISAISVALIYMVGIAVGMLAGLSRSWLDPILMRSVDMFISVPSLLLVLVLVSAVGTSAWILTLGTVIALFPGVSRLVRTATLEVSTTGYVEAAVMRGERLVGIMRREILPNIAPSLIADAGVRFLSAIYLVASLNFLGLGAQPPAANWGVMVAENQQVLTLNIWAVLAPALMIALLAIAVNLMGDAYVESLSKSEAAE